MNAQHRLSPTLPGIFSIVLLAVFIGGCGHKKTLVKINPAFSKYIQSYTSGVISKKSTVRIELASDVPTTHPVNETLKENPFSFSPSVPGKAYWVDEKTIEFKPDKDLQPNELYEIKFGLGKLVDVPSEFKLFTFNVQVIQPSFTVEEQGLRVADDSKDLMSLKGTLRTADVEDNAKIEKILLAKYEGRDIKILWQHNEAAKTHDFVLDRIRRAETGKNLQLEWNGQPLLVEQAGKKEIAVPAVGDFKVLAVRAIQDAEEYALVQFSDPVAINQDLTGLIAVSQQGDISYSINGSEVSVYVGNKLEGDYSVNIHEGIVNKWGIRLPVSFKANAFFENRLPSVSIHGRGTILPDSGGKLVLPFEAVNLKAVDVAVIKIYENNVAEYLQGNDLNGDFELRQVAKPLVQATIKLDDDPAINLHKRNRFSLDIDKYVRTEPGAIYRVAIGFRPGYSLYTCSTAPKQKSAPGAQYAVLKNEEEDDAGSTDEGYEYEDNHEALDEDEEFWSRYDRYYPYGFKWNERDNPCSKSYFNKERFAYRNILATNIGLTAKKSSGNSLLVIATDIISTAPLDGISLEVLDYQRQLIGKGTTDNVGMATLSLSRKPYLLIAKKGAEKSYLKLDDGSALPLSRFDVGGAEVKNGIKGFIFGERGVWRPGDSLFLTCLIEDKEGKLPKEHPVEMELYSPTGQLYKRMVQTNATDGFNVFRTATDATAPTGNWNCKMKIGGAVFEKKLKIETVMANRLKIDLNFGQNPELGKGGTTTGTLTAKWLFGATAKHLKAKVDMQLYKSKTSFPKFETYSFDNPTTVFTPQSKTIFDGSLDEEGSAAVNPDVGITAEAPGVLSANLLVKVFEPGGNFSIDNVAYPYYPYSTYVGVKVPEGPKPWGYLPAGKPQKIDIVNVDTKGNLLGGTGSAEVELYRIQWKWWWDNSGDNLSNFTQDEYNKLVQKQAVPVVNGKASYTLNLSADDWGRYLLLVRDTKSGHVTGQTFYVDDPYWRNRDNKDDASAAAMLSFATDKEKYAVGEEVMLTIPSSRGGRALISIESGSGVLRTFWTETEQGQTKFSFKAESGMAPNVYVNVSLLQPHSQTINDLPIRMYGVVPVLVEDKNTVLTPTIKMPDQVRPEQPSAITVAEKGGHDMTYVIALVDEGLLDLTRFKTPDPHTAFYAKEGLGVKSWDVFDYVIGAWGGDLQRILTIGGDSQAEEPGKKKANRFKPVVQFLGPFHSSGGSKTHSFTLPPYMGSVRAMVIAANRGAYGFAEKSLAVKKPLMLLATMPRVLAPAEEIKIPVTVFATENNIRNVSLRLEANALIEPVGANNQAVVFASAGEQQLYFNARVKPATGIAKVKLVASTGKERTEYEVQLDVRNANPPVTSITERTLAAGQSFSSGIVPVGTGNTNRAVVEISSLPAMNLESRLQYLIQYPHGCIEQVTSSVFPQLVLNQLTELNNQQKLQVDINIRKGIERIKDFQARDGGFGYWPNEGNSDEWGSSYAGNFLLEAAQRGYIVPASMLQQWLQFERAKANAWNQSVAPYYGSDLNQAYRLYLLAMAKAPELGGMNRLREYKFLSPEAKWRLAAAYYLMGQTNVALQMISGLSYNFSQRSITGLTYGSQLRDQAMALETLTIMGRQAEAGQLVRLVANQLATESWYSTQTTAYALIAISRFSGKNPSGSKIISSAVIGSKTINTDVNSAVVQLPVSFTNGKTNVSVTNKGNNVLYMRIINQGQPKGGEGLKVNNHPDILALSVNFISAGGAAVDPTSIVQGTDFIAKVSIKNTGKRGTYSQMALSQIFPGGWEILNTRLYNSEGSFTSSAAEYTDIRDDRVYQYFNIRQNETLTYYVQLNAAYPGKFYWPGTYCEAMYDNTISSGVSGKWVSVVQ